MKTLFALLFATTLLPAQETDERVVLVPWAKAPKEAPLFFSASAEVKAVAGLENLTSEQKIRYRVVQGKAETLTLGLTGAGEVTEVTGAGLKDWSVRVGENGSRFLDVRPAMVDGGFPAELEVMVRTRLKLEKDQATLLLPAPGGSTGFSLAVELQGARGVDLRVTAADGLVPVEDSNKLRFVGAGEANLGLRISPAGAAARGLELTTATISGRAAADGSSVSFRLMGTARSEGPGSTVELLGGGAALADGISGDGWHVALRKKDDGWVYDLIAENGGEFPVNVAFEVPTARLGDWRTLAFEVPAGVVVPVLLEGLGKGGEFDASQSVVPVFAENQWKGYLPASGKATLAWREADKVADGSLFFSTTETTDVRVGSGLLRQMTVVDYRVLQGKLAELDLTLDGPGEVLSVSGGQVLGWDVREEAGKRRLSVKLSRPIEGSARLIIEAQAALGGFPVKAEAMRMSPVGTLRHSGWLRVANDGAVRIEVADGKGLIQLAPAQFPGGVDEKLRQVSVYRFPSSEYHYVVNASQVLPEVGLTEVTVYELAETDRRITADLELDIREAPLREWEFEIPADHAVAAVTGAEVADYVVAADAKNGLRVLKVLFKQAVMDRQLINVRLEKNEAAKAGPWELQPLGFSGVKTRRGYVGAVAAAGYRLSPGKTQGVAEVPVTFFPKKTIGLQQSFRLREDKWSVGLTVEALGQSIQADVFHLYSLKTGAVYGSVLINYFVVGAPATEWKISVPEGIGNIDVTGQNVGRDWRRDGNTVVVPLSRPVLGTGTVLLTFEQPMSSRGGTLDLGEVTPLGVQGERGYVQAVSPLQVNHKETSSGALMVIDDSELPAEFRLLSNAPTLGVWQYTARDFKISMDVQWYESGETVGQVVDFQRLESRVSRDGQWVTDARIFVKSRGNRALRMEFPKDSILWEARVDGATVNAREDGDGLLIPLPAKADPNQAVEVSLRYGPREGKASHAVLTAPRLEAPVVIGEWKVAGDEGRQLVPEGGSADLVRPVLPESGWEWLARRSFPALMMILLGAAAVWLFRTGGTSLHHAFGLLCGLAFVAVGITLAMNAAATTRSAQAVLEYAAPMVAANEVVSVKVANLPEWQARVGGRVWWVFVAGVLAALSGFWKSSRLWVGGGLMLVLAAFLTIKGGAALAMTVVALTGLFWLAPRFLTTIRGLKKPKPAVTAAAAVLLAILNPLPGEAAAANAEKSAETMTQDWSIRGGRLYGTLNVTVRAEAGDRFKLLSEPAVLGGFEGAGLRVMKIKPGDRNEYWLVAESAGRFSGKATFEMPLADPVAGWEFPGGPAAMRKVSVRWDQTGWDFACSNAASVSPIPGLGANESGAVMILGPSDAVTFKANPKQRDVGTEETKFFAEVSNLFIPGPGVVNGRHRILIRPAQGRVSALTFKTPEGFTVSDVGDGPVGTWRFDPVKRELRVSVEPAQTGAFSCLIETQRGAGALPVDLELAPLRVDGAAGEIGFFGLAFGEEVQPEGIQTDGLSRVNPEDFNQKLLPRTKEGQPLALLQNAFRYGAGEVKAKLKVTAVAPELRSESWQLVSLGEDRLVVATDLTVTISRSGVFRLALDIPAGLEIEGITGDGLSHWTESEDAGKRVVTLHLAGKTMGVRKFSVTLSGRPTGAQQRWQVPKVSLREASRETGVLTVVPERGLQVSAAGRRNVSQLDPRELAEGPKETSRAAARPGALAYKLLQADWNLALSINRLDPWVTAKVFHEATIREGQVLSHVRISYKIENAAVKSQRVRIPGLDANAAKTVRATGAAVGDLVSIDGEEGLREIRFQRGIAGETEVEFEYQRPSAGEGGEKIEPVILEGVRQQNYMVAVRAGGRLELEPGPLPRGWQAADWAVVQSALSPGVVGSAGAPAMSFRVADPEGPLPVLMKRHNLAGTRKLRVSEGMLTTLVSAKGECLTAVGMSMLVSAKDTLRLKLPEGAVLFNLFVNDEGATIVREGGDWLFHVSPSPETGKATNIRFVYSSVMHGGERLEGPVLDVPMENLTWRVLVPEGWMLAKSGGDFDLQQQQSLGSFGLEDYQTFVKAKREEGSKKAVALLDKANEWNRAGDQQKANLALGSLVNNGQLDAASGEDARVQLRRNMTQQAVLGLNTRRQKLTLDNQLTAPQANNAQLNRAVEVNPLLRGDSNYDPNQFDRFLEGNTADENAALKEIANRIVSQQLAADPPPTALDLTLPERGTVLSFTRSVQVAGSGRPMGIDLELKRASGGFAWLAIPLCALAGALGVMRRKD
jgi:hypothetical protein